MAKDEVSWTQMKKYLDMPESKFFTMMDKAHPKWKVKSTLISKKKDYALQQAKRNTEWMTPSLIKQTVTSDISAGGILRSGKNKGKVKMTNNIKKTVYIPGNKKSLTNYYKKQKEASYKWLLSRGNLAGLKTYDFKTWLPMFTMFQGNMGSSDSITTVGIGGYEKGTTRELIESLAKAHHGVKFDASDKRCLNYWGLKNVKPVEEIKKSAKKKTTTKKKTVRRVRKAPAKKKTTTKKKKAPAKKKTVRRVRKAPAKKKTTRRKR